MTKKDYERAAAIVQTIGVDQWRFVDCFVEFFKGDNPRFDESRFRFACQPGANVKARTAHLKAPRAARLS